MQLQPAVSGRLHSATREDRSCRGGWVSYADNQEVPSQNLATPTTLCVLCDCWREITPGFFYAHSLLSYNLAAAPTGYCLHFARSCRRRQVRGALVALHLSAFWVFASLTALFHRTICRIGKNYRTGAGIGQQNSGENNAPGRNCAKTIPIPKGVNMAKVALNVPAPDFKLIDFNGETVSLSAFRGEKNLFLVFNRGFM
jgi:hypothetical protein